MNTLQQVIHQEISTLPIMSHAEKIALLKESQHDPLFLADLQAVSDDFLAIDNEEW